MWNSFYQNILLIRTKEFWTIVYKRYLKEILKILVTGGLGFIGSSVIRNLINKDDVEILNIDKSTYAANPAYLDFLNNNDKYNFQQGDITDKELTQVKKELE